MSNSTQSEIGSLVISISSRALFNLDQSHRVFQEQGLDAYQEYQIAREDEPLEQGVAFILVQKLLHLNNLLDESPVEVILLSRNSADTGLRIFNSIQHY
ncbi:MAG: 5'-nucleotidase, partial [Pseudohongiellaceae bacterium]